MTTGWALMQDGSCRPMNGLGDCGVRPSHLGNTGPQLSVQGPESGFSLGWDEFRMSPLRIAAAALAAYHGYRRNSSIGWAVVWAFLGSSFPIITLPVALAQGFGQPKHKSNRRRSRGRRRNGNRSRGRSG